MGNTPNIILPQLLRRRSMQQSHVKLNPPDFATGSWGVPAIWNA